MTKEAYFEMCEALNSEPIDSEIPVDFDDLFIDVQEALSVYHKLRDDWDTVNGNYLGKNHTGINDIFNILEIPACDRKNTFELILLIDKYRAKALADAKPKTSSK